MPALATNLRNKLERATTEARDVAEAGARAALQTLGVHHHEPYPHQTPEQRKLRLHLRAHAKQLGDVRNSRGESAVDHLVHECSYEHWHRMLFARFLAENNLLIEPLAGVPISLQDCEELAKEAKVDMWTYASRCAQQMLPQIFRPDDPLLQVSLASEHRIKLERLLASLDSATFQADDSLGWVYQFWQSKKKDEVNASGDKIGADELSAVTQLFTEHYMVLFLLHNTIGAWHAGKVLDRDSKLAESASNESELRTTIALKSGGGCNFDYLRFFRGSDGKSGPWRPAAGTFPGWPKLAAEIKFLDPCCGSGHFLVAGFDLLVRLRMGEEGLSLPDACDAVLRENLFGLELDARCTQIAAFNLAMAAWKLGGFRKLPPLNVACTGLSVGAGREEWMKLLKSEGGPNLRFFLGELHDLFVKAPTLGSLINPSRFLGSGMLDKANMDRLLRTLDSALADDPSASPENYELGVAAQGLAKAAELLANRYTAVLTNVPYLGRGKQDDVLKLHLETYYPTGKADLATAFVLRCLEFCAEGGSTALVTPQNWLFLTTYTALRETLLDRREWNVVARLGPGAFETIGGHVVNVALIVLSATMPANANMMVGIDVAAAKQPDVKAAHLCGNLPTTLTLITQEKQRANPDARISATEETRGVLLNRYASTGTGMQTFDLPRFLLKLWEVQDWSDIWLPSQSTVEETKLFGGVSDIVRWENGTGQLYSYMEDLARQGYRSGIWRAGSQFWGLKGIVVSLMNDLPMSLYLGIPFNQNTGVLVPSDQSLVDALWCFAESGELSQSVRAIDQALKVTNGNVGKVPFDLARWQKVAAEKYPNGLPEPESDDPTQWLFHGRPDASTEPLQVSVTRLLGYRWPAELDDKMHLSTRAQDLVKRCEALLRFADDDGIVCIPSVRGEEPAADRLEAILTTCGIKPDRDLDDWLRNEFFQEHCEIFHQKPFIWHIWDGRKRDGFHALVNYHKLAEGDGTGRKLLESLTYSYLGEWINRQQDGVKRGADGAEDRLVAATELQKRLAAILEGEPPFDVFVRWKPLDQQAIGWEPDINDGVRINIRPFLASDIPNGRGGAGVLRWKPKIKWEKDRGNEPKRLFQEFPWFWGWDGSVDYVGGPQSEFTGERFNDCHYTNEFKRRARQHAKTKS